jgi:hypothetical protein
MMRILNFESKQLHLVCLTSQMQNKSEAYQTIGAATICRLRKFGHQNPTSIILLNLYNIDAIQSISCVARTAAWPTQVFDLYMHHGPAFTTVPGVIITQLSKADQGFLSNSSANIFLICSRLPEALFFRARMGPSWQSIETRKRSCHAGYTHSVIFGRANGGTERGNNRGANNWVADFRTFQDFDEVWSPENRSGWLSFEPADSRAQYVCMGLYGYATLHRCKWKSQPAIAMSKLHKITMKSIRQWSS